MAASATTLDREPIRRATVKCFHCATPCRDGSFAHGDKSFCCHGCLTVFELLSENGLSNFYELADTAGVRVKATREDQFKYLDEPVVRARLVNFQDERITRITFRIPAIHCIACVWLLENLFRLKSGIGKSQVDFPRKEVAITFENAQVKLSEVVALLASLGYEPELKLSDTDTPRSNCISRRLWLQLALAGFAFGNLMLFSIAGYFGFDAFTGPTLRELVGYLSVALATPVVIYSALDYWRIAWTTLKQKRLAIEVPIAAGIVAIYAQSAFEVLSGRGEGYFDSLCGLIFFLLCGRLFQQKTFDRLSFERDYKSFFPLSVTRKCDEGEEQVALAQLRVGDTLIIHNGELIPADGRVGSGAACIDYSFVTGESEPVEKREGDYLYAGGRQTVGAIEIEIVKPVSQSYLTSLWNQDAFRKDKTASFETQINQFSYRFTIVVSVIALGAAVFWLFVDPSKSLKAFTSVLIVACPCALALAAPFTLGTAIRALGRRHIFVKSAEVVEALAKVDAVVFDKTGTLTAAGARAVRWESARGLAQSTTLREAPSALEKRQLLECASPLALSLTNAEQRWIYSLARQSTHPLSVRIAESLHVDFTEPVRSFVEKAGCGIEGVVDGHEVMLGSAAWFESRGVRSADLQSAVSQVCNLRAVPGFDALENAGASADCKSAIRQTGSLRYSGSTVYVAIDGEYRGCFVLASALRSEVDELLRKLSAHYELALLSGDNEKQRDAFTPLFGNRTQFNQSPLHKLEFIHNLQRSGKTAMMVGDGLNDAGALKQSNVGVAVVENISAFSPASDIIMSASMVSQIDAVLQFSKSAVRIVRLSFLLSSFYNVIGVSIAASGMLAPIVCAILMPISSISVAAFACGATAWAARRNFRTRANFVACAATDGEPTPPPSPILEPLT
jgi:P-type Cu+ transporter